MEADLTNTVNDAIRRLTKDMLHAENFQHDLNSHTGIKWSKKAVQELREAALQQYKEVIIPKAEEMLSQFDIAGKQHSMFEDGHHYMRNAWRLNGDPEHDTKAELVEGIKKAIELADQELEKVTDKNQDLIEQLKAVIETDTSMTIE